MEKWEIARKDAVENIKIADHMLNVTYKLINDPKLLLMILKRVDLALKQAIKSLLYFEIYYKRIPPFHESDDSTIEIFENSVRSRYDIKNKYIKLVKEINMIITEHNQSPMEFVRQDKLVICSDNYGMQVLSEDKIKDFIQESKSFVNSIASMMVVNK